ncbi:hypothetical protein G3570_12265 [Balneolaceae bacterium YR4-1]|uniref:Transposase IS200-like domain-containing protein n=1 Tax=Halalkalibaculum roseum TaxID=2709311 RepID=A0A6M1TB81_9BACT|nr:hypothetical protein [Halalkalibaculum roseum]NGP77413.1 hypothetical protein [Halalkalibaculum roseum]
MASIKIEIEPNQIYHIWTHANGSENLFRSDINYRNFMDRFTRHIHPVGETFAYCLMPNHFHFMIRLRPKEEIFSCLIGKKRDAFQKGLSNFLSQQFSNLLNGYTQSYNYQYKRKGSLFIPNFKRKLIDSEAYFTRLIVYIHNNPVYHGFVSEPGEWCYSSYLAYRKNKMTKVSIKEGLAWFGGIESFDDLHRQLSFEKLATIFQE